MSKPQRMSKSLPQMGPNYNGLAIILVAMLNFSPTKYNSCMALRPSLDYGIRWSFDIQIIAMVKGYLLCLEIDHEKGHGKLLLQQRAAKVCRANVPTVHYSRSISDSIFGEFMPAEVGNNFSSRRVSQNGAKSISICAQIQYHVFRKALPI